MATVTRKGNLYFVTAEEDEVFTLDRPVKKSICRGKQSHFLAFSVILYLLRAISLALRFMLRNTANLLMKITGIPSRFRSLKGGVIE